MPIEQKSIKGDGKTASNLYEIRQRFVTALGQSPACSFMLLQKWLQAPVGDSGKADNNCDQRAKDLAPLLNRSDKDPYIPNLTMPIGKPFPEKWKDIDDHLSRGRIVVLKGPAEMVGGPMSVFKTGFHVLLFLSTGAEGRNRPCYVGFDPDISATEESQKLWDELVKGNQTNNKGVKDLQPGELHDMIKTMILGEGIAGVGPLIRKYYPNREAGLGKINRFNI